MVLRRLYLESRRVNVVGAELFGLEPIFADVPNEPAIRPFEITFKRILAWCVGTHSVLLLGRLLDAQLVELLMTRQRLRFDFPDCNYSFARIALLVFQILIIL